MRTEAQIKKQVKDLKKFLTSNPQHRKEWQQRLSEAVSSFMKDAERKS